MKTSSKTSFSSSLMIVITIFGFSNSLNAQRGTVLEVVDTKESTSEFAQLLEDSGYAPILKKEGPYTILAPSNEALNNVEPELKENPKKLMQGQLYKGNVPANQVESQIGVTVEETDESASNGVVHVVDQVTRE